MVQVQLGTGAETAAAGGQNQDPDIGHEAGRKTARSGQGVPPVDLRFFHVRQVDRHPLSGLGALHVPAVNLQAADAAHTACRNQLHRRVPVDAALPQGAGHYGAESVQREDPVNGQAEGTQRVPLRRGER